MSVRISAPYPMIQTTTFLPNPSFGDSEGLTVSVAEQRSMSGLLYTYVKTKGLRRKLLFTLVLDRLKSLELRAFIKSYYYSKIELIDHTDTKWVGNFTSNPFEFDTPFVGNRQTIRLEFEGIAQ